MLEINGLSIRYGAVEVVHGASLRVEEGEIVALIGPNGAGKSSILKAVSGIKQTSGGNITFMGADIVGAPPHKIVEAGIAHVMEGRHLFGGLNVEDNLLLAASSVEGGNGGSLEDAYRRWPILKVRARQLAGNLSGGEQQMLAIARALMTRPRLIILDEPSWGLAPRVVRELMHTITNLRSEEGTTILLCEQMANLALKICDVGYVMSNGRVVLNGSAEELLSNPDLRATYLGGDVGKKSAVVNNAGERRGKEAPPNEDTAPMPKGSLATKKASRIRSRDHEKTTGVSSARFADLQSELSGIRSDMDRIKQAIAGETIDTVSTSPAYDDLFDPMMSKAAPQPPETHEKDTDVSGVEKEPRHENDASGSRDANRKPEPARGFSSREKARQQKQAAWQAQNKL
ncbi:MAG: ABC transporter ATP-binding protein [Deltaproteobacteria bacterium]|jgi:branched-chain amino acid transport system ATP-binding protein|nr:ABC transporter ATP-binding protein [Deltaproteobacteria bacterium]